MSVCLSVHYALYGVPCIFRRLYEATGDRADGGDLNNLQQCSTAQPGFTFKLFLTGTV